MTSRERVRRAFDRVKADRVPIDSSANPGIDRRLKAHFGLPENDTEGLLRALGVDFRPIGARYKGPRLHPKIPGRQVDPTWGIRTRWIEHGSGGYWDYCDFPLADADEEKVASWPCPAADDFDVSGVAEACARHQDYALCVYCFGDLINGNGMLRGMEQTLIDLATDEPAGLLLADRRFRLQQAVAERVFEAAKGRADILWLGEDLGTQDRQMVSSEVFRKHILPRYKKLIDMGKSYGAKVMIHTCGSSSWTYDDFIAAGLDAVDTLQPECRDMSPRYLMDRFGTRLSFHGCISTAGELAFGDVASVLRVLEDTLEVMMPGRGYMCAPTHSIQDNSPSENVVALYEAIPKMGRY